MPAKITILPPFFSLKTALQLVEKNNMKGIKEIYALRTHKINYWDPHTIIYIFSKNPTSENPFKIQKQAHITASTSTGTQSTKSAGTATRERRTVKKFYSSLTSERGLQKFHG
jgi:hypothetical protein